MELQNQPCIIIRANSITSYHLNERLIPELKSHRDLGVILSDDLSLRNHYTYILSKAYKTLNFCSPYFQVITLAINQNKAVHDTCSFYTNILFTCMAATSPN